MSLTQYFIERDESIDLIYYGINDMGTGFEMSSIVEAKEPIVEFYNNHHDMEINTLEDYVDYNYAVKISKMEEIIPNIIDEDKKVVFEEIVTVVKAYLETINKGKIIKFINSNYEILFIHYDHILYLSDVTLSLMKQYMGGIKKDVVIYIVLNHTYLIVSYYEVFSEFIERNEDILKLLLEESVIGELFCQRQDLVQKMLERFHQKKILENHEAIIDRLAAIVEGKYRDINDDNILAHEGCIRSFMDFLTKIKHVKANQFKDYYDDVSEKIEDYLHRKGHSSTFEIPVGEIIKYLKGIKTWEYRLLHVSHESKEGRICSRLDFPSEGKKNLMDFVSTNHKEDDYYTASHIHKLEISVVVGESTMHGILFDDELFEQSRNCFLGYIGAICELKHWEKEDYYDDIEILYQMLNICRQTKEIDDVNFERGICYGTCTYMCGFMEKLLRNIYVDENKNHIFIDESQVTLGQLLRDDRGTMGNIFGEYHLKHLRYYLSTDTEKKIGLNYRNALDHYTIDKRRLGIPFVTKMLYFFTDVVNSVFLYVQDAADEI